MRRTEKLMNDWMFTGPAGKVRPVDLPHTWNAVDGQDGGNDYYRGSCVYEKSFAKPEFSANEAVYLQFHGVNASARVLFNEKEICVHDNGYSTFRAEVTEKLQEENVLRVEVDNSVNAKVYPQKADFTFYGGIYRDVELLFVSKAHFDLDYYGGPGICVKTDVKGQTGIVHVTAYVEKETAKGEDVQVQVKLLDAEGKNSCTGRGAQSRKWCRSRERFPCRVCGGGCEALGRCETSVSVYSTGSFTKEGRSAG